MLYLMISGKLSGIIDSFSIFLDCLFIEHPILAYIPVYLFIISIVFFCYLSHGTACIIISLTLKDFLLSFSVLLSATIAAEALIFYFSMRVFKGSVVSALQNVKVVHMLAEESIRKPYRTSFITRFL